jgi:hypothetical protein
MSRGWALALIVACQHSTATIDPSHEPIRVAESSTVDARPDPIRACVVSADCIGIPLVLGDTHSGCSISVNRSRVDDYYRLVFKPNEADLRKLVTLTNCGRAVRQPVCVDGLCCFTAGC